MNDIHGQIKGGSFLIGEVDIQLVFTPEDFSDEHKTFKDAVMRFIDTEIAPFNDQVEIEGIRLGPSFIKKAGKMGLLGIEVDESYGGIGLDTVSATILAEAMGPYGSASVTIGAHASIGTLPLYYFGSNVLKEKYLQKLVSGEFVGAYCLTEPGAGSDALNIKAKAVLSDDKKSYTLSGVKQFVTNGGFADLYTVFAKVDGEHFTAFLVERNFEGVKVCVEEKKMGLKGSSTTQVIFDEVKVPIENIVGTIGKGHKIAFSILNIGRFKLGSWSIGCCKNIITHIIKYTSEREQFGRPINHFGLIQEKIARMVVSTWAGESAVYRTTGLIDKMRFGINNNEIDANSKILKSLEEYSIECSIIKVFGSEILDYTANEGIQCFGGYGYISDYPMEKFYRDARISRIYEGTNEINRLLIPGILMKKGISGELPLMDEVQKAQREVTDFSVPDAPSGGLLEAEKNLIKNAKKALLLVAGAGIMKYGEKLKEEQEVLAILADGIIHVYVLESTVLRALKIVESNGEGNTGIYLDIARAYAVEAFLKIEARLKEGICSITEGDDSLLLFSSIKRLMKYTLPNVKELRRNIAKKIINTGQYLL